MCSRVIKKEEKSQISWFRRSDASVPQHSERDGGPVTRTAMSDSPVIFKRSKVKANQRAREEPQQDAQEQRVQSTEDEPSPSAVASKIRHKAKQRVKPKTSLSFGVEEEVSPPISGFSLLIAYRRREMKKSSKLRNLTSVRS